MVFALAAGWSLMTATVAPRQTQPTSAPGERIIRRMHDFYAGKWYRTMTFVQTTTSWDSTGTESVATWYESLSIPGTIRIDFGSPTLGNGVLSTGDSTYLLQKGAVVRTLAGGNILLTLLFDVYAQPLDKSLAVVRTGGYDLTKLHMDSWQGMPVYVIGADAGDLKSPQIWVDSTRLLMVRMITPTGPEKAHVRDAHFDKWRTIGGGWIAPSVAFFLDGKRQRLEEYNDIKTDVEFSPGLFDVKQWMTAPHWAH